MTDNTQSDVVEALEMCRDLMQEAKGHEGPNGGFVTNHLDDAENWLDKALTALTSSDAVLEERWQPRLGEKVRMTDACPDAEQWNRQEWFVAGIQRQRIADRYTPAFDIFVSATWPEITDPTDGFIVNHPTKPDELEPAAIRKGDNA